ncbi:hypothetical protein BDY19DRAFT_317402 [Irpex rosettiformis]|uniref:Uncharacterized protein n=1 Tax=Irpex rosettiformis TaxID=378272 RepID=A0ACB8TY62_9APHY|nr:hypothetical protein BDY19DRAFT_317402 [Irpex rosettiformis]
MHSIPPFPLSPPRVTWRGWISAKAWLDRPFDGTRTGWYMSTSIHRRVPSASSTGSSSTHPLEQSCVLRFFDTRTVKRTTRVERFNHLLGPTGVVLITRTYVPFCFGCKSRHTKTRVGEVISRWRGGLRPCILLSSTWYLSSSLKGQDNEYGKYYRHGREFLDRYPSHQSPRTSNWTLPCVSGPGINVLGSTRWQYDNRDRMFHPSTVSFMNDVRPEGDSSNVRLDD